MEKKWDADGWIRGRDRLSFTQEDLSAYLRDAEQFGWNKLDFSFTEISEIPASIGHLANLQLLDLSNTPISEIPDSIGQLASLQLLDLSYTQISEIPASIGQLANLQSLDLSRTPISEIPDSIGQLESLQSLSLSNTPISEIPDSIGQLESLQSLSLSNTPISEIPDSIGQLESLQLLSLSGTQISEIPEWIGQLANLQSLDLRNTQISEIPDSIGQLESLQSLDLRETQIREIPDSVGQLASLQTLYLRGTQISEIPDSIGQLASLQSLDLSGTQIREIPASIGQLSSLQSLDLRYTQIREIPDSIGQLASLQKLSLGGTQIREIPDSVGQLASLQSLDLRYTQIREIPASIGQLASLQSLSLSYTQISEIPDSIGQLASLQSLDLSRTPISEIPDSIGQLANLQALDLTRTQISEIPDSIGQLESLQSLSLSNTPISEIPDSIGQLASLQTLDLRYCHLKEIPYSLVKLGLRFEIDNLSANNCVNLTGVRLDEGDLQLFTQGRDVIEAYYQNQTQVRECKVIFLGDGGAGKTALITRITKGTFTPGTPPTDGVEMTEWFMSVEMQKWETNVDDKPFIVRFLDFGGQEIMHTAHRCFLTAHTVYVVVCDSRNDQHIDDTAASWLESVNDFAPGCPVILALNKADLTANASVNERDLKERNPNLRGVLKTSAAVEPEEKYGVTRLIDAIRDEIPGAVNDYKMNADMLKVKRALETMRETEKTGYISSKRYREICAEHNITDKKLQYDLLGFFRDLGVAYYYETKFFDPRLESVRVLNPEWLTNGIYRLILRTPESGFLKHQTIKDTLRATHAGDIHREITYTPEETEYILHVMRFFKISHDMGNGVEMLPLKMPKTPPDTYDSFPRENALHLRWEGTYLPNNLIHRLLIRKAEDGELDTGCVWRTGGRFRKIGGGCEALAEMNDKALDVYVSGKYDCRPYLETFRVIIQGILNDLNLKTEEIICHTVNGREGRVSYQAALSHLRNNKPEIYLANIDAYVSPVLLLKEIYVDVDRELARYRQELEHTFRTAPPPPDKPPEKAENPLEEEKTRSEIAKNKSEEKRNKSEEKKNNVAVTLTVARALLIPALIVLAWVAGRSDLIEKFLGFLFSSSNG